MTLVLIHGLFGRFTDPRALSKLEPATILAPDLHGYGSEVADGGQEITIERQVDYVRDAIDKEATDEQVHLVGHSVGGVIAAAYAHRITDRVASFVNVEGNFTLADAFWSREIAAASPGEARDQLERDLSDPARWLRDAGIVPTEDRIEAVADAFAYQPWTTVQAMARAVVEYTGGPEYEAMLREVFARVSVHLVAGERSRSGWHVPDWALEGASSYTEISGAGHMLMLDAPAAFGTELRRLVAS
jgi:pimeloyl-ACP methyl ester carboxylesterase